MLCFASFVVGFFEPAGLHLVGEDGTVSAPYLLHVGGFRFFAVADVGWSDFFFAVGLEAAVFEDLSVDDAAAVFVVAVGADYFYFVVEVDV